MIGHTIILTLALGFSIIWCIDTGRHNNGLRQCMFYALSMILLLVGLLGGIALPIFKGAIQMLPMMLIFYFLRAHRGWMYCIIITFSLLMATLYFSQDLSQIDMLFIVNSDWMQFWVIPFIALYNGKSGPKNAFALIHLGIA
ncbi:MAG: hypothetical protein RSA63_01560 [Eubacterium sp.]